MAVLTAGEVAGDRVLVQRMRALELGNAVRFGMGDVKREIAAGRLSVSDALDDERAQGMPLFVLLCAQRRWARKRALRVLAPHFIGEGRKVRDLTARQRGLVRAALGGDA